MTPIAISRLHFPVTTLGPGRRVGIWLQGCSIRCTGCISVDTWPAGLGLTTTDAVIEALAPWLRICDGITITGGEPFDQAAALESLLRSLRACTDASILVYSGYPYERLTPWLEAAPGLIDALMTEPYDADAPQTLAFRGSDNQRLHLLTPLGQSRLSGLDRPRTEADRRLDAQFAEDGSVWFAGIPERHDLHRLAALLEAAGHRVVVSAQPGSK